MAAVPRMPMMRLSPGPMLRSLTRLSLIAAVFALGAYLQARGVIPSILRHSGDVLYLARQHLALAAISGAIAIAIGVPLGILLTRPRVRPYANAVTQFINLGTTIPTLAINVGTVPLAFLIGGGGLGELIFTGIDVMDPGMLLAGAIPTALLAIIVDSSIGQGQYWLVPRGVNPLR